MAPYQVTIAYDGTDFKGFQRQLKARTVQSELEIALLKLGWKERSILSAGRTDTGVHAEGQVIRFHLDWPHTEIELLKALNSLLPADVSVIRVVLVDEEFHPRFDAVLRKYRYQLYFSPITDPLKERFYWRVWPKPDFQILKTGAALFIGTHDLCGYGKPPAEKSTTIRTIQSLDWEFSEDGKTASLEISAKAFLYHMVRRIVYVLVRAGQKSISLVDVTKSLEQQLELPAGIAPAKGLILEEIIYQ